MQGFVKLFEPGRINQMGLKNRIVMAPLGHGMTFASKPDGFVTDQFIAFYAARARGGVGFIQLTVAGLGRPFATGLVFSPGILSLVDDEHIESGRRFTDAMHAFGTKVSFQLTHHGSAIARAVQRRPPVEYPELMRVVSSSGFIDPATGFEVFEMTRDEIAALVEAFARAAKRGKAAGFDAVRIQGCHSYLIQQFLSPRINKRKDEYGGTVENRARLACQIIQSVRKAVGPEYPIIIRMNGSDHVEGGITLEDAVEQARLFEKAGADALDISSGPSEAHHWQFITMYQPSSPLVPLAKTIKKAVKIPVIAVGKIDATRGEEILRQGSADFIQLGRPLMCDPELANKARAGLAEDIRPCIYCGWCTASGTQGAYANCTINMMLGKEMEPRPGPAAVKKKVVVVGGGPAGMEAAHVLAERGHQVTLFEKTSALGGQWALLANYLPDEAGLIDYLKAAMNKAGVRVLLGHEAGVSSVLELKPDAVVLATGSTPLSLAIPGATGTNVVQAVDVLEGKAGVGERVVVVGGRVVGISTALYLAQKGKCVSIVTRSQIARGFNHNARQAVFEYLIQKGIYLYPGCVPDSITGNGVNIWWNSGETANREAVFAFLPADTVVLAVGARSKDDLETELKSKVGELYSIGDCSGKRSIFAAVRGGAEIGDRI
jgi:2,4-dienoyl-CoA reductase-like NADH-dependent reductase (Old Yellow Enzyme family)/thioredoxin reductase